MGDSPPWTIRRLLTCGCLTRASTPGTAARPAAAARCFRFKQPARLLRIVGQAPLVAMCWECERLRCSGCGLVHTAAAPCEARGVKYSESAVAMIAMQRYGLGVPFHRVEPMRWL
jgi:hypothetical protein